jgi:streptogramin lyase
MRAALAIVLLLAVGCTANGPAVRSSTSPASSLVSSPVPSSSPAPSRRPIPTSGGVIEYPLPNPGPPGSGCVDCRQAGAGAIAAGADGNLWFADSGNRAVGRITPSGAVTEFAFSTAIGAPYGIGAGPDGNIWVTTDAGTGRQDSIVKISPAGAITSFQAGTRTGGGFGTGPESIAAGPDGNLWFTEYWSNRIGRMTPSGALTEFPIPTPESSPRGIVAGPDGNVWFVEAANRGSAIARMTTKGVVTEFPLGGGPTDQLQPDRIVAGPDGSLWFSQAHPSEDHGEIGRMMRTGSFSLFTMPKGTIPGDVAVGPDGNIWFADPGGNTIGRMSLTGAVRLFALPTRSKSPSGLAAGADGRMWFTEGGWIGSIGTTVPEPMLSAHVVNFGSTPTDRGVDITNVGDADLKIGGVAVVGSDRALFTATRDDCTGHSLAASESCHVDVSFTPSPDQGAVAARLAITDNATASPQTVSLMAQLPDCKLPLFASSASSPNSQGEFLSLRSGTLSEDPRGRFVTSGFLSRSEASPVLNGQLPATYDRAAGRWVPAWNTEVSPDGSRYAYVDYYSVPSNRELHVVNVATGTDRILSIPTGLWGVVGFTSEGIYLNQSYDGISPGLTLVNPDTGAVRTVFTDSVVNAVSGQVAWVVDRNPNDTLPGPQGQGRAENEVLSRDLATSKTTAWIYRPGTSLAVVAAGNGSILVQGTYVASDFLLVVTAPGQAQPVTVPETDNPVPLSGGLVADSHGWWIGSLDGVYLWTPHTGAILVSELTAGPTGPCA